MSIYLESESDPANYDIAAHRGLVQWYEGDGNGAPPSGDGSTWALRNNNGAVAWTGGAGGASGTEFDAVATATVAIDGTWQDFNVLADVADFVSGAETNYGWWLLGEEGVANSNKRFFSSDHATAGTRPKLVVVYAVPSGLAGTGPRARGRGRGR